jgi:hypothetical protein
MQSPETHPFNSELSPSEFISDTTRLQELKNNPDKVVRSEDLSEVAESIDRAIVKYSKAKALLDALGNKYNVAVPKFDYVLGEGQDGQRMYTVVDKVIGKGLDTKIADQDFTEEEVEKLEELYLNLVHSLADIYISKKDYLKDIYKNFQFVYGHTARSNEDKYYLVDIGPEIYSLRPDDSESEHDFSFVVNNFAKNIRKAEKNVGKKFNRVRERLQEPPFTQLLEVQSQ